MTCAPRSRVTGDDSGSTQIVGEMMSISIRTRRERLNATPAPVETAVHEDDEGPQVLFVLHPGTEDIDAHIALPGSMVLVDALSGERFELAQEAVIRMPAKTVRMFLLQQTSDSSAHGSRAKRGTA